MLVVFDNIQSLPVSEFLHALLKNYNTHIIVTTNLSEPTDNLKKEIDHQLLRGCDITQLKPLSVLHTTQRIVHSILRDDHFTPLNREQEILTHLAESTCGSPTLVDIVSALLQQCIKDSESGDFLGDFTSRVELDLEEARPTPLPSVKDEDPEVTTSRASGFTSYLIDGFNLPSPDFFLLSVLSIFGPVPIPRALVEGAQSLVLTAKFGKHCRDGIQNPLENLFSANLVRVYPSPVIVPPGGASMLQATQSIDASFYYVPQLVCDALWEKTQGADRVFSITVAYKALLQYSKQLETEENLSGLYFAAGLAKLLVRLCDTNYDLLTLNCYREAYRLFVACRTRVSRRPSLLEHGQ